MINLLNLFLLVNCYIASNTPNGFLAPEASFIFNVECNHWQSNECEAAKADLANVGAIIGRELYFKVPINVCVNQSFVPTPPMAQRLSHHVANTTILQMACNYY